MKNHGYWYNQDAWHPGKEPKRYACPSDTEFEKWMNCINYPDYFVSDQGKVWSIYSGPKVVSCGSVALCSGGRMVNTSVRQLVAAAFLPPKEEGQVLRYRNGDKTDIRACNLYWAHPYRPKSHKRGRPKRDPGALLISNSTSLKTTAPIAEPRKVTPKEKKSL